MNPVVFAGPPSPGQESQWHQHEEWELLYCARGGRLTLDPGQELTCPPGGLAAVPPRTNHMSLGTTGIIRLDAPALRDREAFTLAGPEGRFAFVFGQAAEFSASQAPRRELVLEALGDLVTGYILTELGDDASSEPVERIRSYINRGFARTDFTLEEIIRETPFNYDYLRRSFKRETGMTPHEYLTELRMRRAGELLSSQWSPARSVTEVAEQCGYSDPLYFSRVFHKHYGCSPSAYARRLRRG